MVVVVACISEALQSRDCECEELSVNVLALLQGFPNLGVCE